MLSTLGLTGMLVRYLDCGGYIVHILGTEKGCSHSNIEFCALKLVLKMMHCDKV